MTKAYPSQIDKTAFSQMITSPPIIYFLSKCWSYWKRHLSPDQASSTPYLVTSCPSCISRHLFLLLNIASFSQSPRQPPFLLPSSLPRSCMYLFSLIFTCEHALKARCTAHMMVCPLQTKYQMPGSSPQPDRVDGTSAYRLHECIAS